MGNVKLKNKLLLIDNFKDTVFFVALAVIVGLITGALCALFGRVLIFITEFREEHVIYFIPFLGLVGVLIIFLYKKLGGSSRKGMSLVFEAGFEEIEAIPKRLIPLVMFTTWITHLFGASAGREGVAVQIGADVGHFLGRITKIERVDKILMIAGMTAGFGGLFQTPLAGTFFALEALVVGRIATYALLPSLAASFVAAKTSSFLGLEKFSVALDYDFVGIVDLSDQLMFSGKLIIAGICFGIAGLMFSLGLKHLKPLFARLIKNEYHRIFAIGCMIALSSLLIHYGRYSGLGTNIISNAFNGGEIYYYDWILKILLTVISLAVGFQGGEVTPLFAIGASLGTVLGALLGVDPVFLAALGYAGVFASATNTVIGPSFIGAEVFGYKYMMYFVIVCAIAYIVNGNYSIYSRQKVDWE